MAALMPPISPAIMPVVLPGDGLRLPASSGYASTPGAKTDQALSVLGTPNIVTSKKWYPRPKPAVGASITVAGGTHRANGEGSFVSTALTVDASFRFLETRDEASDEYSTTTTVTETIGAAEYVFSVTTMDDPGETNNAFPYEFPFTLE